MRYWLIVLFAHFMLGISVLWMIQHVAKVRAYGWLPSLGLTAASDTMIVVAFLGLAFVYGIQLRLALIVLGMWRRWLSNEVSSRRVS